MRLECGCPSEYPDWDRKDINLAGHCVHRLPITAFLHMPITYEAFTHRQQNQIAELGHQEPWPGFTLTRTGLFGGEIIRLLNEETESPSRRVGYLPVPFMIHARLHQGDVTTIKNTVKEMQMDLLESGKMPKELYLSYLTCPLCAEQRGGEKMLIVRRWVGSKRLEKRKKI